MDKFILFFHFAGCLLLIISVLLQSGKTSAMGGLTGAGGGDALFAASSGTSFIKKFTASMAILVALTSIALTVYSGRSSMSSVLDKPISPAAIPAMPKPAADAAAPAPAAAPAAATPAAPAAAPAKAVPAKKAHKK